MRSHRRLTISVAGLAVVLTAAAALSQNTRKPGDQRRVVVNQPARTPATRSVTLRVWLVEAKAPVEALAGLGEPLPRTLDSAPDALLAQLTADDAISRVEQFTMTTLTDGRAAQLKTGSDTWSSGQAINLQQPQRNFVLGCSAYIDGNDQLSMSLSMTHKAVPPMDQADQLSMQTLDLRVSWLHQVGRTLVVADRSQQPSTQPTGSHWYLLVYATASE